MTSPLYCAMGLMSGTSIDGIDVALIETDAQSSVRPLGFQSFPYDPAFRDLLRKYFGRFDTDAPDLQAIARQLTERHAEAALRFIKTHEIPPKRIDLIGFHGQTLFHKPEDGITIQIGDGALLAKLTGISVVNDFRTADVKAGGQGAPLVPLYHKALAATLPKPVAIVNIGGISNVTWIGSEKDDEVLAFDLGPGNALIDDWMLRSAGRPFDDGGKCAAQGTPDRAFVESFRSSPYFKRAAPKSLDRDQFAAFVPHGLSVEDGAATLTLMTVMAICDGLELTPKAPSIIYMTGGGRHNATLCKWVQDLSGIPVASVDDLGWDGDAVEAEAFAYLAVRSRLGLPLSMPLTTGVKVPMTGGEYHKSA